MEAHLPGERLLRARDIHRPCGILPISRSQFYALIARGEFPRGTRLADNIVTWKESRVWEWVRERAESFEKYGLSDVSTLSNRQAKGVHALKAGAGARWRKLTDDLVASGLPLETFVDIHWREGSSPFIYETRTGTKRGYDDQTMLRELRKELKKRRKAIA
jgi:predicted DNA-binding transcriptional regulator AlpA